jgi:hypothetical protein
VRGEVLEQGGTADTERRGDLCQFSQSAALMSEVTCARP